MKIIILNYYHKKKDLKVVKKLVMRKDKLVMKEKNNLLNNFQKIIKK